MKEDDVVVVSSDSEEDEEIVWTRKTQNKQYQLLWEQIKPILYYQVQPGYKLSPSFPYAKFQELANDLKKSLALVNVKSTRAFIWKNLIRWLISIRLCYENVSDCINDRNYNLILTDFMAQYVNYKCQLHSSITDETEVGLISNEIVITLSLVFSGWVPGILMTLLKIQVIDEYQLILYPIFRKYLSNKHLHEPNDLISYLRLILCFRKWKKLTHLKEDKEIINEIAVGKSAKALRSDIIDLSTETADIDPVLPKTVPSINEDNRSFANITGLIGFASKNQEYGTRILLINKTLELDDTIDQFFKRYNEYINRSTPKLLECSRAGLKPTLIEDLTRSPSPDQLLPRPSCATQETSENVSKNTSNVKQGTKAVNQYLSNNCDISSISVNNKFNNLNLNSHTIENLSPSCKNTPQIRNNDVVLSLRINNVIDIDNSNDEDDNNEKNNCASGTNSNAKPMTAFEKQLEITLERLKNRAMLVGNLVNRVKVERINNPVVAATPSYEGGRSNAELPVVQVQSNNVEAPIPNPVPIPASANPPNEVAVEKPIRKRHGIVSSTTSFEGTGDDSDNSDYDDGFRVHSRFPFSQRSFSKVVEEATSSTNEIPKTPSIVAFQPRRSISSSPCPTRTSSPSPDRLSNISPSSTIRSGYLSRSGIAAGTSITASISVSSITDGEQPTCSRYVAMPVSAASLLSHADTSKKERIQDSSLENLTLKDKESTTSINIIECSASETDKVKTGKEKIVPFVLTSDNIRPRSEELIIDKLTAVSEVDTNTCAVNELLKNISGFIGDSEEEYGFESSKNKCGPDKSPEVISKAPKILEKELNENASSKKVEVHFSQSADKKDISFEKEVDEQIKIPKNANVSQQPNVLLDEQNHSKNSTEINIVQNPTEQDHNDENGTDICIDAPALEELIANTNLPQLNIDTKSTEDVVVQTLEGDKKHDQPSELDKVENSFKSISEDITNEIYLTDDHSNIKQQLETSKQFADDENLFEAIVEDESSSIDDIESPAYEPICQNESLDTPDNKEKDIENHDCMKISEHTAFQNTKILDQAIENNSGKNKDSSCENIANIELTKTKFENFDCQPQQLEEGNKQNTKKKCLTQNNSNCKQIFETEETVLRNKEAIHENINDNRAQIFVKTVELTQKQVNTNILPKRSEDEKLQIEKIINCDHDYVTVKYSDSSRNYNKAYEKPKQINDTSERVELSSGSETVQNCFHQISEILNTNTNTIVSKQEKQSNDREINEIISLQSIEKEESSYEDKHEQSNDCYQKDQSSEELTVPHDKIVTTCNRVAKQFPNNHQAEEEDVYNQLFTKSTNSCQSKSILCSGNQGEVIENQTFADEKVNESQLFERQKFYDENLIDKTDEILRNQTSEAKEIVNPIDIELNFENKLNIIEGADTENVNIIKPLKISPSITQNDETIEIDNKLNFEKDKENGPLNSSIIIAHKDEAIEQETTDDTEINEDQMNYAIPIDVKLYGRRDKENSENKEPLNTSRVNDDKVEVIQQQTIHNTEINEDQSSDNIINPVETEFNAEDKVILNAEDENEEKKKSLNISQGTDGIEPFDVQNIDENQSVTKHTTTYLNLIPNDTTFNGEHELSATTKDEVTMTPLKMFSEVYKTNTENIEKQTSDGKEIEEDQSSLVQQIPVDKNDTQIDINDDRNLLTASNENDRDSGDTIKRLKICLKIPQKDKTMEEQLSYVKDINEGNEIALKDTENVSYKEPLKTSPSIAHTNEATEKQTDNIKELHENQSCPEQKTSRENMTPKHIEHQKEKTAESEYHLENRSETQPPKLLPAIVQKVIFETSNTQDTGENEKRANLNYEREDKMEIVTNEKQSSLSSSKIVNNYLQVIDSEVQTSHLPPKVVDDPLEKQISQDKTLVLNQAPSSEESQFPQSQSINHKADSPLSRRRLIIRIARLSILEDELIKRRTGSVLKIFTSEEQNLKQLTNVEHSSKYPIKEETTSKKKSLKKSDRKKIKKAKKQKQSLQANICQDDVEDSINVPINDSKIIPIDGIFKLNASKWNTIQIKNKKSASEENADTKQYEKTKPIVNSKNSTECACEMSLACGEKVDKVHARISTKKNKNTENKPKHNLEQNFIEEKIQKLTKIPKDSKVLPVFKLDSSDCFGQAIDDKRTSFVKEENKDRITCDQSVAAVDTDSYDTSKNKIRIKRTKTTGPLNTCAAIDQNDESIKIQKFDVKEIAEDQSGTTKIYSDENDSTNDTEIKGLSNTENDNKKPLNLTSHLIAQTDKRIEKVIVDVSEIHENKSGTGLKTSNENVIPIHSQCQDEKTADSEHCLESNRNNAQDICIKGLSAKYYHKCEDKNETINDEIHNSFNSTKIVTEIETSSSPSSKVENIYVEEQTTEVKSSSLSPKVGDDEPETSFHKELVSMPSSKSIDESGLSQYQKINDEVHSPNKDESIKKLIIRIPKMSVLKDNLLIGSANPTSVSENLNSDEYQIAEEKSTKKNVKKKKSSKKSEQEKIKTNKPKPILKKKLLPEEQVCKLDALEFINILTESEKTAKEKNTDKDQYEIHKPKVSSENSGEDKSLVKEDRKKSGKKKKVTFAIQEKDESEKNRPKLIYIKESAFKKNIDTSSETAKINFQQERNEETLKEDSILMENKTPNEVHAPCKPTEKSLISILKPSTETERPKVINDIVKKSTKGTETRKRLSKTLINASSLDRVAKNVKFAECQTELNLIKREHDQSYSSKCRKFTDASSTAHLNLNVLQNIVQCKDELIKNRNQEVFSQITHAKLKNSIEPDSSSQVANELQRTENTLTEEESNLSTRVQVADLGEPSLISDSEISQQNASVALESDKSIVFYPSRDSAEDQEVSCITSQKNDNNLVFYSYNDENGTPVMDEKNSTEDESPSTQCRITSLSEIQLKEPIQNTISDPKENELQTISDESVTPFWGAADENLELWFKKFGALNRDTNVSNSDSTKIAVNSLRNQKNDRKQKKPQRVERDLNFEDFKAAAILTSLKDRQKKRHRSRKGLQPTRITRSASQIVEAESFVQHDSSNIIQPMNCSQNLCEKDRLDNLNLSEKCILIPSLIQKHNELTQSNGSSDSDDTGKLVIDFDAKKITKPKAKEKSKSKKNKSGKRKNKKATKKPIFENIDENPCVPKKCRGRPRVSQELSLKNCQITTATQSRRGSTKQKKDEKTHAEEDVIAVDFEESKTPIEKYEQVDKKSLQKIDSENKDKLRLSIDIPLGDSEYPALSEKRNKKPRASSKYESSSCTVTPHNMNQETWLENLTLRKTSKSLDSEVKQLSGNASFAKKIVSEQKLPKKLKMKNEPPTLEDQTESLKTPTFETLSFESTEHSVVVPDNKIVAFTETKIDENEVKDEQKTKKTEKVKNIEQIQSITETFNKTAVEISSVDEVEKQVDTIPKKANKSIKKAVHKIDDIMESEDTIVNPSKDSTLNEESCYKDIGSNNEVKSKEKPKSRKRVLTYDTSFSSDLSSSLITNQSKKELLSSTQEIKLKSSFLSNTESQATISIVEPEKHRINSEILETDNNYKDISSKNKSNSEEKPKYKRVLNFDISVSSDPSSSIISNTIPVDQPKKELLSSNEEVKLKSFVHSNAELETTKSIIKPKKHRIKSSCGTLRINEISDNGCKDMGSKNDVNSKIKLKYNKSVLTNDTSLPSDPSPSIVSNTDSADQPKKELLSSTEQVTLLTSDPSPSIITNTAADQPKKKLSSIEEVTFVCSDPSPSIITNTDPADQPKKELLSSTEDVTLLTSDPSPSIITNTAADQPKKELISSIEEVTFVCSDPSSSIITNTAPADQPRKELLSSLEEVTSLPFDHLPSIITNAAPAGQPKKELLSSSEEVTSPSSDPSPSIITNTAPADQPKKKLLSSTEEVTSPSSHPLPSITTNTAPADQPKKELLSSTEEVTALSSDPSPSIIKNTAPAEQTKKELLSSTEEVTSPSSHPLPSITTNTAPADQPKKELLSSTEEVTALSSDPSPSIIKNTAPADQPKKELLSSTEEVTSPSSKPLPSITTNTAPADQPTKELLSSFEEVKLISNVLTNTELEATISTVGPKKHRRKSSCESLEKNEILNQQGFSDKRLKRLSLDSYLSQKNSSTVENDATNLISFAQALKSNAIETPTKKEDEVKRVLDISISKILKLSNVSDPVSDPVDIKKQESDNNYLSVKVNNEQIIRKPVDSFFKRKRPFLEGVQSLVNVSVSRRRRSNSTSDVHSTLSSESIELDSSEKDKVSLKIKSESEAKKAQVLSFTNFMELEFLDEMNGEHFNDNREDQPNQVSVATKEEPQSLDCMFSGNHGQEDEEKLHLFKTDLALDPVQTFSPDDNVDNLFPVFSDLYSLLPTSSLISASENVSGGNSESGDKSKFEIKKADLIPKEVETIKATFEQGKSSAIGEEQTIDISTSDYELNNCTTNISSAEVELMNPPQVNSLKTKSTKAPLFKKFHKTSPEKRNSIEETTESISESKIKSRPKPFWMPIQTPTKLKTVQKISESANLDTSTSVICSAENPYPLDDGKSLPVYFDKIFEDKHTFKSENIVKGTNSYEIDLSQKDISTSLSLDDRFDRIKNESPVNTCMSKTLKSLVKHSTPIKKDDNSSRDVCSGQLDESKTQSISFVSSIASISTQLCEEPDEVNKSLPLLDENNLFSINLSHSLNTTASHKQTDGTKKSVPESNSLKKAHIEKDINETNKSCNQIQEVDVHLRNVILHEDNNSYSKKPMRQSRIPSVKNSPEKVNVSQISEETILEKKTTPVSVAVVSSMQSVSTSSVTQRILDRCDTKISVKSPCSKQLVEQSFVKTLDSSGKTNETQSVCEDKNNMVSKPSLKRHSPFNDAKKAQEPPPKMFCSEISKTVVPVAIFSSVPSISTSLDENKILAKTSCSKKPLKQSLVIKPQDSSVKIIKIQSTPEIKNVEAPKPFLKRNPSFKDDTNVHEHLSKMHRSEVSATSVSLQQRTTPNLTLPKTSYCNHTTSSPNAPKAIPHSRNQTITKPTMLEKTSSIVPTHLPSQISIETVLQPSVNLPSQSPKNSRTIPPVHTTEKVISIKSRNSTNPSSTPGKSYWDKPRLTSKPFSTPKSNNIPSSTPNSTSTSVSITSAMSTPSSWAVDLAKLSVDLEKIKNDISKLPAMDTSFPDYKHRKFLLGQLQTKQQELNELKKKQQEYVKHTHVSKSYSERKPFDRDHKQHHNPQHRTSLQQSNDLKRKHEDSRPHSEHQLSKSSTSGHSSHLERRVYVNKFSELDKFNFTNKTVDKKPEAKKLPPWDPKPLNADEIIRTLRRK